MTPSQRALSVSSVVAHGDLLPGHRDVRLNSLGSEVMLVSLCGRAKQQRDKEVCGPKRRINDWRGAEGRPKTPIPFDEGR